MRNSSAALEKYIYVFTNLTVLLFCLFKAQLRFFPVCYIITHAEHFISSLLSSLFLFYTVFHFCFVKSICFVMFFVLL